MAERDAKKVAEGLSAGDRQRLLSLPAHGDGLWRGYENLHLESLIHLDVIKTAGGASVKSWRAKATPLGLAVRDHLRGEQ